MAQDGECCLDCGYSLAVTDEVFGADPVLLDRVTDAAGVLSEGNIERLKLTLDRFESRFPQLFAAVYCGALPPQTSLRQFGFWLLNRAAVSPVEATRPNENGALFVVDTHGRSATLVLGYFLECYLDERDSRAVLEAGRRDFHRGLWASGLCMALGELGVRIARRAAEAAKTPGRFAPPRPPSVPEKPAFVRLRHGHRHQQPDSPRSES